MPLMTVEDVLQLAEPDWLVEPILPAGAVAQLYGESETGKTFVALDMALSIATGRPWLGSHSATQGRVIYVAAEGLLGLKKRLLAWMDYHSVESAQLGRFRLLGEGLQLAEQGHIDGLVSQVEATFPTPDVALVVLDTQARCTEGLDENSAKEMGVAIAAADRIKRETGATVLLIHHTGYDKSHARGSTAVRAALECQIELRAKNSRERLILAAAKMKDFDRFDDIELRLTEHDYIGSDEKPGSSLVTLPLGDGSTALRYREQDVKGKAKDALAVLREVDTPLASSAWQKAARAAGVGRSTFFEAKRHLLKLGLVHRLQGGKLYSAADMKSSESTAGELESSGTCS